MRLLFAILVLIGSGSVWAQEATVADNVRANLRSGKAENYRVIKVLPESTPVEVLATDQEYAKVRTEDGQVGWLLVKLLNFPPADSTPSKEDQQVQDQLREARDELARLQGELEQERNRPQGKPALVTLLASALGGLAAGVALGIMILQAYYRRRLHGLRI